MTTALMHLLAIYAVLAAPWLGQIEFQQARKRMAAGLPDAKVRLYRSLVVEQIVSSCAVLFLWRSGRVSATALGLVTPRLLGWSLAALFVVVGILAWSGLRLRPKAQKIKKRLQNGVGALVPDSQQDQRWWGAVSLGAGVSEELVFRGFLLYYLSAYLPQISTPGRVFLTALFFGLAHIYQGWHGAVSAGIIGLVLAGIYVVTGSLLLPIVIHAATDARVLLIFPPDPRAAVAAESHASVPAS